MTLAGACLVSLALLGPSVIAALTHRQTGHPASDLGAQAALCLLAAVALAGVLWLATPAAIGLTAPNWSTPLVALALAGFFTLVWGPVLHRLAPRLFDRGLAQLAPLGHRRILLATLVGGTAEEVLYRCVGFGFLAAQTGMPLAAASVSIAAFAMAHVPLWGVRAAASFVVPAAILTAVYHWTGDLVALIVAHVVTDALGLSRTGRNRG
ncbi:MAG: CPBP family intramembrane glutamic endopeptidase [Pseudomonadota bacterium]